MHQRFSILVLYFIFSTTVFAQTKPENNILKTVVLPNGWAITAIGNSLPLGDLPLNMVVSNSKRMIAVTNNGQSVQSLQLIDVANEKVLDNLVIPKSFYGLKISADDKFLFASGGNDNRILKYSIIQNHLQLVDSFYLGKAMKEKISPAGIDLDESKNLLFVVTKESNSLYVIHLKTKKIVQQIPLPDAAYSCLLSKNKKQLYISCWGCDKVLVYDISEQRIVSEIKVGDNPNELLMTKNGKYLFVSNANDNSVSVIDLKTNLVIETLNAALFPDAPRGSTSNGLALSNDEKTLFVANADNNCLAVFDVSEKGSCKGKGFIPTGWYPTNVKVIDDKIWVCNGKGFSSKANPHGPNPINKKQKATYQKSDNEKPQEVEYIGGLFKGTMSIFSVPNEKELSEYSKMAYVNSPYTKQKETMASGNGSPIPNKVGNSSPIKYVFYIIKENRTYDQVLGDVKEGNGDTLLVLFGKHYTPNQHALAKQFALLDNFYVDGEVSADGHNWSMGAYATDYLEKTWPTSYGGRGGSYDAEGNREIANNRGGFIWDLCSRQKVSYRTYGEFADNFKPNIPVLKNHLCKNYTGWNPAVADTTRFQQWKNDFDSLLAIHQVPQFNSLRFPNDHTEGLRKNAPTPFAYVADNDLATGLFVDYLSHSSIWNESVVFILEDDAQNGPDHVDAHRSPVYVAGGKVKTNFVDHTMYSTSSVLRTMELILGMPPMTQYDAAAEPMWRCFTDSVFHVPFQSVPCEIDLHEKNIAMNEWQKRSELFDFKGEDRVPDLELNKVLWYGLKGEAKPFPSPVRAAFVKRENKKDDN